jgi:hypothetical protein
MCHAFLPASHPLPLIMARWLRMIAKASGCMPGKLAAIQNSPWKLAIPLAVPPKCMPPNTPCQQASAHRHLDTEKAKRQTPHQRYNAPTCYDSFAGIKYAQQSRRMLRLLVLCDPTICHTTAGATSYVGQRPEAQPGSHTPTKTVQAVLSKYVSLQHAAPFLLPTWDNWGK